MLPEKLWESAMEALRKVAAGLLSLSLLGMPLYGGAAPESVLGTVVYADHAYVGTRPINVGGTVFGGDRLSTDEVGTVQVRTSAARLLLTRQSIATMGQEGSATLKLGTATFSTANAKAFSLHVASAVIRPNTDLPTVAQVSVINSRELVVRATRGDLSFGVGEDVRLVPEGMAYHVVLDPTVEEAAKYDTNTPDDPQTNSGGRRNRVIKAGRSNFIWYAIGLTALATAWAIDRAVISPDRPR